MEKTRENILAGFMSNESVLKKHYNMDSSRLVRYFKDSRDNWKKKALEKQKKLRLLEQKVRDLEKSREQWKYKAKESEKQVKKLAKKIEEKKTDDSQKTKLITAKKHHYSICTIKLSIQQVINGGNSYRSVGKTMKLLSENFEVNSPHFSSIRKWIGRVGLYELLRTKEKREDWIFIVDLTLELGREKAMIIYGISSEKYQNIIVKEKRALKHTDGEILSLEVTSKANGEFVREKLEILSNQVGIPQQILADHGSNLKKGLQLYQKDYPDVIYTYDVTHAMSNLLKQQLSLDQIYQNFIKSCHQCRLSLQQTELAFLAPPSQRSQCRYFNVERLINWGKRLLNAPIQMLVELIPSIDTKVIYKRLKQKISWLINYKKYLDKWEIMVFLTRSLELQLKLEGINQQSLKKFEKQISSIAIPRELLDFKQKIVNYISLEISKLKPNKTVLATTDVLESIFGKYKHFSSRCPLKDLRQMLLTIPLFTINFTTDVVKTALETVRDIDLQEWVDQVFDQSMLSKRKTLFSAANSDMESA